MARQSEQGYIIGPAWDFWHLPAFSLRRCAKNSWNSKPFVIGNIVPAVLA